MDRFNSMVARLEQESAHAPRQYRVKVAILVLLGFAILALVLATVGFGLVALAGIAAVLAYAGGAAWLLLLKLGKLLFLLAIPLWFTLKSAVQALFIRLPAPQGREITRAQAPALFDALDEMRQKMQGPRFHHVLIVDEMNAAIVQRPAFGLVGWPRNYLLLGLPLLECLSPDEAMAVVAHEYGHLAGAHGRFSAYVYRLRHTWTTLHAFIAHFEGWLARLVAPLVRWYAPYFNAYTFVLARADEYRADAASVQLVGSDSAARALKRVNLVGQQYQLYLQSTYQRANDEATPPKDLLDHWAVRAREEIDVADTTRWLEEALDREGHFTDTHPTLRARLSALTEGYDALHVLPPAVAGESAGQAWFGSAINTLRSELQEQWAAQVTQGWAERYAETQAERAKLQELRNLPEREAESQIEMLSLSMRLEPEVDLREELAAFNAANRDHAFGLYLQGVALLDKGERLGLSLLDRAMEVDPEATKAACQRAYVFLSEQKEDALASEYVERWRKYDEGEARPA
ncbi:M48 family metalloprotease [Massilia horti]|nr:M48 family metallopeptidase [Massilia horti]